MHPLSNLLRPTFGLAGGMVSVGGNLYSVPDATRKRIVEVHTLADEVRIFEDGNLIAAHPVLEGRNQRRIAPGHRRMARIADHHRHSDEPILIVRTGDVVPARPLDFYQAVGRADIPTNPNRIYANDGWAGYSDWLGNERKR